MHLQPQVFIKGGRRAIESVHSTHLIPIETNVAVDQEVAYPELLQQIWMLLTKQMSAPQVADLLDTAGKAIILLDRLPSRPQCSIYLHLCRRENAGRNSSVV